MKIIVKTMDNRKFNKILCKIKMKGLLKLTDTYEKADLIFVINPYEMYKSFFTTKKLFQENKDHISDYAVIQYVKHTNPRNTNLITAQLIEGKYGVLRR